MVSKSISNLRIPGSMWAGHQTTDPMSHTPVSEKCYASNWRESPTNPMLLASKPARQARDLFRQCTRHWYCKTSKRCWQHSHNAGVLIFYAIWLRPISPIVRVCIVGFFQEGVASLLSFPSANSTNTSPSPGNPATRQPQHPGPLSPTHRLPYRAWRIGPGCEPGRSRACPPCAGPLRSSKPNHARPARRNSRSGLYPA